MLYHRRNKLCYTVFRDLVGGVMILHGWVIIEFVPGGQNRTD